MPQPNPYTTFVLKVCTVRSKLISAGINKGAAMPMLNDIKRLKMWIAFYGNKGETVAKAWFEREASTIEGVMTPNFDKQYQKLKNGNA